MKMASSNTVRWNSALIVLQCLVVLGCSSNKGESKSFQSVDNTTQSIQQQDKDKSKTKVSAKAQASGANSQTNKDEKLEHQAPSKNGTSGAQAADDARDSNSFLAAKPVRIRDNEISSLVNPIPKYIPDPFRNGTLRVRVANLGALKGVDKKIGVTLYKNGMRTDDKALAAIAEVGEGFYCQTEGTENINAEEVLDFPIEKLKVQPFEKDKTFQIYNLFIENKDHKFTIVCTAKGSLGLGAVVANFETILDFSDERGIFEVSKEQFKYSRQEEVRLRNSVRIKNLPLFKKIIASGNDDDYALIGTDGQVDYALITDATVIAGYQEITCNVTKTVGEINDKKIYKLNSFSPIDENSVMAVMGYEYESQDKSSFTIFCRLYKSTKSEAVLDIFQNVFEFGVQ